MSQTTKKVFSFARMMVLAQRRHDARQAAAQEEDDAATPPTIAQRAEQARRTLQKMNGTKRLVVFMYAT
jgi:hypothetical protein